MMLPFAKLFNTYKLGEYDKFVFEIASLPTASVGVTNNITSSDFRKYKYMFSGEPAGLLYGTPIDAACYGDLRRVAQHCFPTQEIYEYYRDNGAYFSFVLNRSFTASGTPFTKNGYTSSAATNRDYMHCITEFTYYDHTIDKVMIYNPSVIGSIPREYYDVSSEYGKFFNFFKNRAEYWTDSDAIPNTSVNSVHEFIMNFSSGFENNTVNAMTGSSLYSIYSDDRSRLFRIAQQSFYSQEHYENTRMFGDSFIIRMNCSNTSGRSAAAIPEVTKNGYTSIGVSYGTSTVEEIIYYDRINDEVVSYSPRNTNSTPRKYFITSPITLPEIDQFYYSSLSSPYITDCYNLVYGSWLTYGQRFNLCLKNGVGLTMYGSPYKSFMGFSVVGNKMAQHTFPSEEMYNQYANGMVSSPIKVKFSKYSRYSQSDVRALNRNGYQSENYTGSGTVGINCIEFAYYDPTLQKVMWYSPAAQLSEPTEVYKDVYNEYERYLDEINLHPKNEGNPSFTYINEVSEGLASNVVNNTSIKLYTFLIRNPFTPSGNGMYGTPWGEYIDLSSASSAAMHRVIQHSVPSIDIYNSIIANGRYATLEIDITTAGEAEVSNFTETTRNGYKSNPASTSNSSLRVGKVTKVVYYDDSTGFMMKINPYEKSEPTRYYE